MARAAAGSGPVASGHLPARNGDREATPFAQLALNPDGAAMQSDQFVDECQADAGTLEAAPLTALDSVKPLEEPGFLCFRNPNAGVGDRQREFLPIRVLFQQDRD